MRRLFAVGVLATLTACSQPAAVETDATAETAPAVASTPASDPSKPGGGLIGEVSSLSGEITAFRVSETATSTVVELASDVLFAFDSADLAPGAAAQLTRAADLIHQGAPGTVRVVGYTDAKGDDAYNLDLSLRRARSVLTWLSTDGNITTDRLTAEGKGEADPVAPNAGTDGTDNPDGRALNRRVEIVIPRA